MKNALILCAIAAVTILTSCKKDTKDETTTTSTPTATALYGYVGNDTTVYVANADASVSSYSYSGAAAQLNKTVKVTVADGKISSLSASDQSFKMKVDADVLAGNLQTKLNVAGKTIAMTGTQGSSDIMGDRTVTITAKANGTTLTKDAKTYTELVISKVE